MVCWERQVRHVHRQGMISAQWQGLHTLGDVSIRPYMLSAVPLPCKGRRLFWKCRLRVGLRHTVESVRLAGYRQMCQAASAALSSKSSAWPDKFVLLGSVTCSKLAGMMHAQGLVWCVTF